MACSGLGGLRQGETIGFRVLGLGLLGPGCWQLPSASVPGPEAQACHVLQTWPCLEHWGSQQQLCSAMLALCIAKSAATPLPDAAQQTWSTKVTGPL